jgi:hypothetical protein
MKINWIIKELKALYLQANFVLQPRLVNEGAKGQIAKNGVRGCFKSPFTCL